MRDICRLLWCALIGLFRSRASLEAEILVLRHQLNVLRRKSPERVIVTDVDRLVFAGPTLYHLAPGMLKALKIVKPKNGYCERAIGSIRRDCLDHVIVLGERHLLHVLRCYASYYNWSRTHLSLNKDAPSRRPVHALGTIEARPVLGGLHHHYVRI